MQRFEYIGFYGRFYNNVLVLNSIIYNIDHTNNAMQTPTSQNLV